MIGAVDIGGTKFAVGMVDRAGEILARAESPSDLGAGWDEGLARILSMLRSAIQQADGELEGVGIGCTGPVNPLTGEVGRIEFLQGWEGHNLAAEIQAAFGVTVALENDADAAALGEFAWGAGQGSRRFVYITVSTGIGVGMVFDGLLYRGAEGAHPEIGHHVIDPSGPQCFCGARGCWESLAGGLALARRGKRSTARAVCEAAERGDPAARTAVAAEAEALGLGIANLVTLFVPDVIALGGGVMQSRALFWDKIEQTVRQNCGLVPFEKTRLVPANRGRDTGLAGAAQAWIQHFREI
jgi:glucokinase